MDYKILSKAIIRATLILLFIFSACYLLFLLRFIFIYVGIASVIALIFYPIIRFSKRKLNIPPKLAILFTFLTFLFVVFFLFSRLIPFLIQQGENLSFLDAENFDSSIENLWNKINTYLSGFGIDILDRLKNEDFMGKIQKIPIIINMIFDKMSSFGIAFIAAFFIAFFLLKDGDYMKNKIKHFIPEKNRPTFRDSFYKIKKLLSRYFIGLLIQLSILFCIYTTVLFIFKINNPMIIALVCCIFNLVPYLGPIIAGILMCIFTMLSNLHLPFQMVLLPTTAYVMLFFFIAQILDMLVMQPLIFSKSVQSHPLEIFLVILSSGFLFGILGMMVAVPSYTVLKIIFKSFIGKNKLLGILKNHL